MALISKDQVVSNKKLLKDYKQQLVSLTDQEFQAALGVMLGDASLQSQDNEKTYRLKFEQGGEHKDYMDHLYNLFYNWSLSPPREQARINANGNTVVSWTFQTFSHTAFVPLADIFFRRKNVESNNVIKSIGDNFVKNHVTPLVLAYWFMDDGGKMDYGKNQGKGIVFNTHGFEKNEVEALCLSLSNKFNLECWAKRNKKKYIVAISGKSYEQVLFLIKDLVIPSLHNKFPSPRRERQKKS